MKPEFSLSNFQTILKY